MKAETQVQYPSSYRCL